MPISSPSTPSLVPNTQNSSGASVKSVANVLRLQSQQSEDASLWSSASDALTAIQRQLDFIMNALRSAIPQPDPIQVTAPDGSLIAEIGILLDQQTNTSYSGIWGNNLFIGGNGPSSAPLFSNGLVTIIGKNGFLELQDGSGNIIGLIGVFTDPNTGNPFSGLWTNHLFVGGTGPDSSPLFSNGTETAIGKNGYVGVLDPYNNLGAWLGTQSESSQNISGAINDGTGQIKITIVGHGYRSGDWLHVTGVPSGIGQWVISVPDVDHAILLGSTFTSGGTGTASRFFSGGAFETIACAAGQRVTAVSNNGGLIQLTIPNHGYKTGYVVVTTNINGIPGGNGEFLVTVVDANNITLQGSAYSGAYAGGGMSLNWPTAKFLAQGDGSLLIQNALISLAGSGASIVIDPTTGSITVTGTAGPPFDQVSIANGQITLQNVGTGHNDFSTVLSGGQTIQTVDATNNYGVTIEESSPIAIWADVHTATKQEVITATGYGGSFGFGPLLAFYQRRGTGAAPAVSQAGDILGGILAYGYDNVGEGPPSYPVGVFMDATETHSATGHGTKIAFQTTNIGSTIPATRGTIGGTSPWNFQGIPIYANNAAAIGGGLVVGDLYRTGANPDPLCIVH